MRVRPPISHLYEEATPYQAQIQVLATDVAVRRHLARCATSRCTRPKRQSLNSCSWRAVDSGWRSFGQANWTTSGAWPPGGVDGRVGCWVSLDRPSVGSSGVRRDQLVARRGIHRLWLRSVSDSHHRGRTSRSCDSRRGKTASAATPCGVPVVDHDELRHARCGGAAPPWTSSPARVTRLGQCAVFSRGFEQFHAIVALCCTSGRIPSTSIRGTRRRWWR